MTWADFVIGCYTYFDILFLTTGTLWLITLKGSLVWNLANAYKKLHITYHFVSCSFLTKSNRDLTHLYMGTPGDEKN